MSAESLIQTAEALIRTPTAPFREIWMGALIDRLLKDIPGLQTATDRFGNRIVRLRRGRTAGSAVTFVAHLDHPGFVLPRTGPARINGDGSGPWRCAARFEGRVMDAFFPGAPVRFFRSADDEGIPGRVVEAAPLDRESDNREAVLEADADPAGALLAMWDVPVFRLEAGRIHARVCDDLCGAAAMIEALRELAAGKGNIDVSMVFTLAEEAGFCGALCMVSEDPLHELLPKHPVFISVEISSETPTIRLGDGAVIRTGDRSTTFDGPVCDLINGLAASRRIAATRALMDKGTCEATAFARAGFRAGGICAPVRHYHNMDMAEQKIAPEIVSVSDLRALRDLIAALAEAWCLDDAPAPRIRNDFDLFLRKGMTELARQEEFVADGVEV